MTHTDFLLNAALHYAFKAQIEPTIDRDECLLAYAIAKFSHVPDATHPCILRMMKYRGKSGFVFDQYFFSLFKQMPHKNSSKVLPDLKRHFAVIQ